METRKTKLGADHPDTLTSMNNLAWTWKHQNRPEKALELMIEVVQLSKRIVGSNHPNTRASIYTLDDWCKEL